MTLISSLPNMIVANVLNARGLPSLNFFSVTPFGLSVFVAGIAFMLLGRGLLSRQQTVEVAKTKAPRAEDLLDYYGLTSWWHRLQLSASSPLIGRSVTQLRSLYDQFGVIPVGLERNGKGKTRFMPALPETVFETGDALFVTVPADQAQQLVETQKLTELPRLEPAQSREALQELGVAELMLAPESKLIAKTVGEINFRAQYQLSVLAVRHRGERLTANLAQHRLDFGEHLPGWVRTTIEGPIENFSVLRSWFVAVGNNKVGPAPQMMRPVFDGAKNTVVRVSSKPL